MKRAKYSKLLAVLLTAAMMLTMLPTVAFAEDIESSPVDSCTVTDGCTLKAGHEGDCVTEATAEETLNGMIASLPAPKDIDPEDEEQLKVVYNQIGEIKTFAEENGIDVEENETINAVIAALYPAQTLDDPGVTTAEEFEAALEAGGTVALGGNITIDSKVDITITKDVVLDLKGYTVTKTYGQNNHYFMTIRDGGSLTLTDSIGEGTLIASHPSWGYGIQLRSNSTFVMNGGKIQTTQESIDVYDSSSNVAIEINAGEIIATADSPLNLRGSSNVVAEINGGTLTSGPNGRVAVYVSSYQVNAIQFDIKGGSIIKEGTSGSAIQAYSGSTITISGDALIKSAGYSAAIQVQGGVSDAAATTLNVDGGSITSDGSHGISVEDSAKVNISAGTISGNGRVASAVYAQENSTVEIIGGTLTGTKAAISESSSSQSTITVTSGTFSSDISTYTNGLPVVSDGNGNYIIRHLSEVYLNGQSGDDTKGGADVANAVKTLDTALRLVADDGVIYICGQVTIDTDTELNNAVFKRAESYNGSNSSLFYVTSQATLTLSDVVIDGDNIELGKDAYDGYSYAYLIKVYNGSTLKIKDGADLKNNGARAIEVYQSSLDMSGGKIRNNHALNDGAAIYIEDSTVRLSGGEISGNSSETNGGGILILHADVTLSGTEIKNNSVGMCGGGVFIWGYDNNKTSSFTMTDGAITGNTYGEYYSGGGIYAYGAGTTVEITGGEISGNSCANRGDAVSLYGSGSNSYPTLKLSGSPTIFGDIFLWDGEDEGPVIQIVDEFAPAVPVPVAATYRTEGTAAVSYMNGLIPDASQFASTEESMGLIQSGQDLIWIEKYSVAFKDETDKNVYARIYVMPHSKIDESLIPTVGERTGFYVAGWRPYGAQTLWNFDTDSVEKSSQRLLIVWGVKQPDTVSLTADHTTVHAGESIILTASAVHEADTAAYVYSWYKDGVLLNGKNESTLTVTESGSYTVKVEAVLDAITSAALESAPVVCTIRDHTFSTEWKSDVDGHWHECTVCGTKADTASHTYGDWEIVKSATETETGEQQHTCTACGYVERAEIPVLEHTHSYGTEWKSDNSNHWQECACGEKSDMAAHTYGDWTVTKAATAATAGSRERSCTVCGYKVAETIASSNSTPQTGDTSNLTLWIALLLLASGGLAGTIVYSRKRKTY